LLEQLLLGDEVDRAADADPDDERVEEAAVVRGEDQRPRPRDVLATVASDAPEDQDRRLEDRANDPVHDRPHAAAACTLVVADQCVGGPFRAPHALTYHRGAAGVTLRGRAWDASFAEQRPAGRPPRSGRRRSRSTSSRSTAP